MKKIVCFFNLILFVFLGAAINASAQTENEGLVAAMQVAGVDAYGRMNAPDGSEWTYAVNYERTGNDFKSFVLSVYNGNNELVGKVADVVPTEGVTAINDIDVHPLVTQRFFNGDDNYEVMLFMHGTTKDYVGRFFNVVYSLTETTQKVSTIDGQIATWINVGTDTEEFTLVFQQPFRAGYDTYLKYDVYKSATEESNSAELAHTFSVNAFNTVSAYGVAGATLPIMLVANNGKVNYFVSEFEKMYMESDVNKLNIVRYDDSFTKVSTTKVSPINNASYTYSIPLFGLFEGENDVIFNYTEGADALVVAMGHTTDGFSSFSSYSLYLFDVNGNMLSTIASDIVGFATMSDIEGHSQQLAFHKGDKVVCVDFPTLSTIAELPLAVEGKALQTSFVRCQEGDTYQYVAAFAEEELIGNEVIQCVAWFGNDANLLRCDTIRVGADFDVSYVHLTPATLNPNLFNSDDAHEYFVSAFREGEDVLLVCNNKGDVLYEFETNEDMGGKIAANYLLTNADKSTLVLVYSNNNQKYTLNYYDLLAGENDNTGDDNTGDDNTGDDNTGDDNTGDDNNDTETALDNVETTVIFDGKVLMAEGDIHLFNMNGQLIMQGVDRMNVAELSSGVYVVKTATAIVKVVVK